MNSNGNFPRIKLSLCILFIFDASEYNEGGAMFDAFLHDEEKTFVVYSVIEKEDFCNG